MLDRYLQRFKAYILEKLGITELKKEVARLEQKVDSYYRHVETIDRIMKVISSDNSVILEHIRFLNSNFFVSADINYHKSRYDPSVILVYMRGSQQIVQTFTFDDRTTEQVHNILRGFGKENVRVDNPRGWPNIKFRY